MRIEIFPELRSALSAEWIHLQDMHAIFAGWRPLEPFNGPWGNIDKQKGYKRISTGKKGKPAESDFVEMARLSDLYGEVDLLIKTRNNEIDGNGNAQIRIKDAFKVGLKYSIPFIKDLHEACLKAGLITRDPVPQIDYSSGPWRIKEQGKEHAYDPLLTALLVSNCVARFPVLTEQQVLMRWEDESPSGIFAVSESGFSVLKGDLSTSDVSARALRTKITRRVENCEEWPFPEPAQ